MSIEISRDGKLFSLTTAHSLYQMGVDEIGVLQHLYYGRKTETDMSYLIRGVNRGFSGQPYEKQEDRTYSLDLLPQEYSTSGVGDYRTPSVTAELADGSRSVDWRFAEYRLLKGKEPLEGLPSVRGDEGTEGLEIVLEDRDSGLEAELRWFLFPETDVITRSVRIRNTSGDPIRLTRVASVCLDFPYGRWEAIHFHGRHCMERQPERMSPPRGGSLVFESRRGMSSHQSNPFVIVCDEAATERQGDCYGSMLVYSGNHLEEIGVDQAGSLRLVSGIHPEGFSWTLEPGESFQAPEAMLSYSAEGLNALSRNYHRTIREHVIPAQWRKAKRPVLLNSWEASYFDFNADSLLDLARSAKELGVEMLVVDDGWFGARNDDTCALGDWTPNEGKLGCSLSELAARVHQEGLLFGLWFEPEMISENSDLFRAHPEWALRDPDRKPNIHRSQMVLDMGRTEVQDYLYQTISGLVDEAGIDYIKWDFNRSVANCYSGVLPPERQGEAAHRFMLGTYRLLDRLVTAYPGLLLEGCSGGGGRFDAGMLYYSPQIWCSDDTDAIERLEIQRGTSYGYPVSTMGAHVSAVPNHQTGRKTPMNTRGLVAQAGTFGYELNPAILSEEEKEEIRRQISEFRSLAELISEGDYYRLTEIANREDHEAWMIVSPDRGEAIVTMVTTHVRANGPFPWVRMTGLDADAVYRLEGTEQTFTGAALMYGGYSFEIPSGDYPAVQLHLIRE